jgi:sulfur-carrier protein
MIRVVLPSPLRALAQVDSEIGVEVAGEVTLRRVLDAVEAQHPVLRGTIRDHVTFRRRAFIRFYATQRDLSHDSPDELLPASVVAGTEPLLIVGAMAGG